MYVVYDDLKNYFDKCVVLLKLLVIVSLKLNLLKVVAFYFLKKEKKISILIVLGTQKIKRDIIFAASLYL